MGRPEHQKVTQISANPSKRVRYLYAGVDTPIPLGQSLYVDVFSPEGYISQILGMTVRYPFMNGATAGSRTINVDVAGGAVGMTFASYEFNVEGMYRYGQWDGTGNPEAPEGSTAQTIITSMAYMDALNPIRFTFQNQCNVPDTGLIKHISLWLLEEKIT